MDEEGCGEGAAWPGVCLALTNLQTMYPSRMHLQVPSYIAFQETPLQSFWPAVLFVISIAEVFSVRSVINVCVCVCVCVSICIHRRAPRRVLDLHHITSRRSCAPSPNDIP